MSPSEFSALYREAMNGLFIAHDTAASWLRIYGEENCLKALRIAAAKQVVAQWNHRKLQNWMHGILKNWANEAAQRNAVVSPDAIVI